MTALLPLFLNKNIPVRDFKSDRFFNAIHYIFVGANCVRPLEHNVNRAGEHSSPLQKQSIEFALFNANSTTKFYN